ncbi:hypothetical protein chiPu_0005015 [Chiloscyllium punctatum]|uniref:Uncharacterized protein n=1 Tax=Chiloscyllium punctatum TaxID=137246 RepID=A0A401S873_CHIPU|nr:hypothetical protein [Chiloscyllium punctatum]
MPSNRASEKSHQDETKSPLSVCLSAFRAHRLQSHLGARRLALVLPGNGIFLCSGGGVLPVVPELLHVGEDQVGRLARRALLVRLGHLDGLLLLPGPGVGGFSRVPRPPALPGPGGRPAAPAAGGQPLPEGGELLPELAGEGGEQQRVEGGQGEQQQLGGQGERDGRSGRAQPPPKPGGPFRGAEGGERQAQGAGERHQAPAAPLVPQLGVRGASRRGAAVPRAPPAQSAAVEAQAAQHRRAVRQQRVELGVDSGEGAARGRVGDAEPPAGRLQEEPGEDPSRRGQAEGERPEAEQQSGQPPAPRRGCPRAPADMSQAGPGQRRPAQRSGGQAAVQEPVRGAARQAAELPGGARPGGSPQRGAQQQQQQVGGAQTRQQPVRQRGAASAGVSQQHGQQQPVAGQPERADRCHRDRQRQPHTPRLDGQRAAGQAQPVPATVRQAQRHSLHSPTPPNTRKGSPVSEAGALSLPPPLQLGDRVTSDHSQLLPHAEGHLINTLLLQGSN